MGAVSALAQSSFATITDEVKNCIERSVLCWLATVDEEGCPHVFPREIFSTYSAGVFLIANVASPGSIHHIGANPKVCVSLVDIFVQKGYKLQGHALVVNPSDELFKGMCKSLFAMAKIEIPIRNIIAVGVEKVSPVIAPVYQLMPEKAQEAHIRTAMDKYGVRPKN